MTACLAVLLVAGEALRPRGFAMVTAGPGQGLAASGTTNSKTGITQRG
jgi:hypothetical protein